MIFRCYGFYFVGVLDDYVGVRVYGNSFFFGVEVEDFGCVGVGDSDKLVFIYFVGSLKVRFVDEKSILE